MSGKDKELKFEKVLSTKDAADFLRALAQEIEHGIEEGNKEFDLSFDDFKKMKIGMKRVGDQLHLKAKVKTCVAGASCGEEMCEEGAEADDTKPKYKTLKKRMDKCFKAIGDEIKHGMLPGRAEMEVFIADAEQMVSYPGHGDEYYDQFSTICVQFNVAYENGDLAAMQEKYAELKAMKKHCHNLYKK